MYLEKYRLRDQVAVVTGGARGLSYQIARALRGAGAETVIADIARTCTERAAARLCAQGLNVTSTGLDVTDSAAATEATENLNVRHRHVDVLINNAGVSDVRHSIEVSDEHFSRIIDVNGFFWYSRAFVRHITGWDWVVNIESMPVLICNKDLTTTAYNGSKAAVHPITKCLAAKWASRGVRVNTVAPGYVLTGQTAKSRADPELFETWMSMTELARATEPHEIASAALFLASDASSYRAGSILSADGRLHGLVK